jgi:predicted CXXCH cytochrome family protein
MRVRLVEIRLRAGGNKVRLDHALEVESLYIGRGPDNDLCLKGLTVSLHHATIRIGDGHAYVEAAPGSEIQVNGLPTAGERLSVGDEIRIGPWLLRLLRPSGGEDIRLEYERSEHDDDTRSALDARTRLGIERGLLARRPLAWAAIGTVIVAFLMLPLVWPAARPLWTTGDLSRGHAIIENDCTACHSGSFRGVANAACTSCHVDVRRHAPADLGMAALEQMRCAACHLEHRGREVSLADQGARFCVTCHADLASTLPEAGIDDASDFEQHHPPIRLAMVVDPTSPPVRETWSPDLVERSGLSFDHGFHVSQPLWRTDDEEERLDCGSCHALEADGVSMAPVDFDRDCRRCHALDPGEAELADQLDHGPADRIREQLRTFYTNRVLEARVRDPEAPGALRRRRPGPLVSSEERTLTARWVGARVADADETLFDEACDVCHDVVGGRISAATGDWEPRAVAPVRLTRRWIEHARFAHADHATQACARCHPGAAVRDPDVPVDEEPAWARPGAIPYGLVEPTPDLEASDSASHVLIPGIATCRDCHSSEAHRGHQKVVSPCSACHDFHDHRLERMTVASPSRSATDSGAEDAPAANAGAQDVEAGEAAGG